MISVDAAQNLARQHLLDTHVPHGECIEVLEFPDGSVTFHFARTDTRFIRNGNLVEVCQSPGTIVMMVDRKDSAVFVPPSL